MATKTKTARTNGKPAKPEKSAPPPAHRYHTKLGNSESTPGRFDGCTLEEVISAASIDSIEADGDVSVWDGNKLIAVAQWDRTKPMPVGLVHIDHLKPKPPRPHRYSNQKPMLQQSITFNPPWSPDCPLTIEIILLPEGTDDGILEPDADRYGTPLDKEDLRVLEEAGWEEYEHTAVRAYIRIVH